MKSNPPSVSVILTVYNRAEYLDRCINSLLNQSFTDWELIAVDDGSSDKSLAVLREFKVKNPEFKIISHQNMKLPLSRNKGIELSKGKYITFLDSDDEYEKDHLIKRVNYMNKHPEIDMISGGVQIIGNEYVRDKNNPLELIHLSECTIGATFFGRRNVFIMLNGFRNIEYSEDSDFLERAEKCFRIGKVDFNTYKYYREAPDSITNSYLKSVLS